MAEIDMSVEIDNDWYELMEAFILDDKSESIFADHIWSGSAERINTNIITKKPEKIGLVRVLLILDTLIMQNECSDVKRKGIVNKI